MTTAEQNRLVNKCLRTIPAKELGCICFCAARGWGEARNIQAIRATAQEMMVREKIVLAAFGWLHDLAAPEEFADAFCPETTPDYDCPTLDNATDAEVTAAFTLARLAFGGRLPGSLAYDAPKRYRRKRVS
jgi:hypothetical protein